MPKFTQKDKVGEGDLLEHLFRHQYGRILATLIQEFGSTNFKVIEDSIQEGFLKALRVWPLKGTPENPAAWLQVVSRNGVLDQLRKLRTAGEHLPNETGPDKTSGAPESRDPVYATELGDEFLQMMFACCSHTIPDSARAAIALKWLSGFSTKEIARSLLQTEASVAQRISRARARLQKHPDLFAEPHAGKLQEQLPAVQQMLYLIFNAGYLASHSDKLVREELCLEAMRLTDCLLGTQATKQPSTHALMALFCFHASRLRSRDTGSQGLLLLSQQDRGCWDKELISRGVRELKAARQGNEISRYHLEAGIASCHSLSPSFAETNWEDIVFLYEELLAITESPVVALNYATAVSYKDGALAGRLILKRYGDRSELQNYYLYWAVLADFSRREGDLQVAQDFYVRAIELADNEAERRFLERRLQECV